MKWHEFIFSEKPIHRWVRHLTFWVAWWGFFFGTFYSFQQLQDRLETSLSWNTGMAIKAGLIVLTHMIACYASIYFLLSYFLQRRWIVFVVGAISVLVMTIVASYALHKYSFPIIDYYFPSNRVGIRDTLIWTSLNSGLLSAAKVIALAVTIKLLKRWWVKQKEKETLEKEKINTELQLLRAQIHPDFLFGTLNSIHALAANRSPKTPEMLLGFSDLLSYMLYECSNKHVSLEMEIKMMEDYIQLEKHKYGHRMEVEVQVKGDSTNKMISPLLLLPFIENSFRYCSISQEDHLWINLSISIGDHFLDVKLINGLSAYVGDSELSNVKMRLEALFPNNYKLRASPMEEMFVVNIQIPLIRVAELEPRQQAELA